MQFESLQQRAAVDDGPVDEQRTIRCSNRDRRGFEHAGKRAKLRLLLLFRTGIAKQVERARERGGKVLRGSHGEAQSIEYDPCSHCCCSRRISRPRHRTRSRPPRVACAPTCNFSPMISKKDAASARRGWSGRGPTSATNSGGLGSESLFKTSQFPRTPLPSCIRTSAAPQPATSAPSC